MADLTIPYGRNAAGHMMAAENVSSGAACGCVCPGCERPLVAHHGVSRRARHFQHFPDSSGAAFACRFAYETSVHSKAKDIVLAHTHMIMPTLMAAYGRYRRQAVPAGWHDYCPVGSEVWLADIGRRPDVMVETQFGPLAIEIYVAHRAEANKRAAFASRGLAAVEIDLSGYDRAISSDPVALANAVLSSARREWLFHPRKAEIDGAYAAEVIEAERIAAEKEAARLAAIAEAEAKRAVVLAELREKAARIKAENAAKREAEEAEDRRAEAERLAQWEAGRAERERHQREAAAERDAERAEAERFAAAQLATANAARALRRLELAWAAAHSAAELLVLAPIRMKDRDGAIQRARATATAARVRYVALAAEQRKASQPVLAI